MTSNTSHIRRWVSWLVMTVVFGVGCWLLSQWQFSRQAEVVAANQLINKNFDSEPRPLSEVIKPTDNWNRELEYLPVEVSGNYLPDSTYLVRNRPFDGRPGFLQLAAFKTTEGTVIWVERGWLPTGNNQDSPDNVPKLSDTKMELTIRLRPSESDNGRTAPAGQLANIDLLKAGKVSSFSTYQQAYGRLASESDPQPRGLDLGKPVLSEGNHLSYAMQWILFGLMAFGAVFWNISQDRRRMKGLEPRKLKSLYRDRDAEIEDEILK